MNILGSELVHKLRLDSRSKSWSGEGSGVSVKCPMTSSLDAPSVPCFSGVITSLLALYLPIEEVLGMGVFTIY